MDILQKTHQLVSKRLVGQVINIGQGKSRVELKTISEMVVDSLGLIHGGFVFGLADYAAMLAVNKPTIVLGKSEIKFIKPVKVGDKLIADAEISDNKEKRKKLWPLML